MIKELEKPADLTNSGHDDFMHCYVKNPATGRGIKLCEAPIELLQMPADLWQTPPRNKNLCVVCLDIWEARANL